jgi:hydroxypyruvate isomerase
VTGPFAAEFKEEGRARVPRFSANLSFLWNDVPFVERFDAAARAGFEAVEYMFPYAFEPEDLSARLRESSVRQDLFNLPAGDFDAGERGLAVDPMRRDEFRTGVDQALRYADMLECRKLNCLAGLRIPGVPWDDQFACLVENLTYAADRVGAEGATLHLELLNATDAPGFFVDSVPLVMRVLDAVDSPHLLFLFDVYHLQRTSGDLVATIRKLGGRIGHYQVADAPDRHEPGTGEIAYPFVFEAIEATGYEGFIGLEYRPSGRTEDPFGWIEEYGYAQGAQERIS